MLPLHSRLLRPLDIFCPAHIIRILSGQRKFRKSKRVGTVGRSLSGGNQLVRRGDRIVNLRHHPQNQIFRQCPHNRPVLDVRAKLNLHTLIRHALGIKDAVFVNISVKMIFIVADLSIKFGSRRKHTFVCRRRRNGSGIHERHGRNLTVLQLRALPVGEVSCGMPDAERIVCRRITRAEAWPAKCRFQHGACLQDCRRTAVFNQFHVNRHGCRIYA